LPADRLGVFDLRVAEDDLRQGRHGLAGSSAAPATPTAAPHALVIPLSGVEVLDELNRRIDRRDAREAQLPGEQRFGVVVDEELVGAEDQRIVRAAAIDVDVDELQTQPLEQRELGLADGDVPADQSRQLRFGEQTKRLTSADALLIAGSWPAFLPGNLAKPQRTAGQAMNMGIAPITKIATRHPPVSINS